MLDLKFVRENPEAVKKNIENKFQFDKLPLVDEVIELDAKNRAAKAEGDSLRAARNKLSKQIGQLMAQGKKQEAEAVKGQVKANADRLDELQAMEAELEAKVLNIMMTIPNMIDPSVPIGKDDSENVEIEKFGEPAVPDFEVPYHTDIMKAFDGIDLDAAAKVAGNGFCQAPFRGYRLCPRFYDRAWVYLLRASLYDPQQRRNRGYVLCRNGCHDV